MGQELFAQRPRLKAGLLKVWGWYCDVADARSYSRITEPVQMPTGALGWQVKGTALRLSHADVDSWCRLNGFSLEGWQLAAIQLIDESHVKLINDPPLPSIPVDTDSKDKSGWLAIRDIFKKAAKQ